MRAEFSIEHGGGDLLATLCAVLGPDDPAALGSSSLSHKSPTSANAITYSAHGPGFVLMAWPTPHQLFLYVESSGRLRRSAEHVWDVVCNGGAGAEPRLKSLVLLDEDANDEVATAEVGFAAHVKRPEMLSAFFTGALTALWLPIALATFDATGDIVLGAIPALATPIVAAVITIVDVRRRKLVWR